MTSSEHAQQQLFDRGLHEALTAMLTDPAKYWSAQELYHIVGSGKGKAQFLYWLKRQGYAANEKGRRAYRLTESGIAFAKERTSLARPFVPSPDIGRMDMRDMRLLRIVTTEPRLVWSFAEIAAVYLRLYEDSIHPNDFDQLVSFGYVEDAGQGDYRVRKAGVERGRDEHQRFRAWQERHPDGVGRYARAEREIAPPKPAPRHGTSASRRRTKSSTKSGASSGCLILIVLAVLIYVLISAR